MRTHAGSVQDMCRICADLCRDGGVAEQPLRPVSRVLTTAIVLETSKGNFQFALALGGALLLLALLINLLIVCLQGGRPLP